MFRKNKSEKMKIIEDVIYQEQNSYSKNNMKRTQEIDNDFIRSGLYSNGPWVDATEKSFYEHFNEFISESLSKISQTFADLNLTLTKEEINKCGDMLISCAEGIIDSFVATHSERMRSARMESSIVNLRDNVRYMALGNARAQIESFKLKENNRKDKPELIQQVIANKIAVTSLLLSIIALGISVFAILKGT